MADAHSNASAACRAFQDDRISAPLAFLEGMREIEKQTCARQKRNIFTSRQLSRFVFQTKRTHLRRSWAEEDESLLLAGFSEFRILTEKSIAGMNSLCARCARSFQNRRLIEIAFGGR